MSCLIYILCSGYTIVIFQLLEELQKFLTLGRTCLAFPKRKSIEELIRNQNMVGSNELYSYFMPVCSIVKTITPRCRGRPDALLHEAEGRVQ